MQREGEDLEHVIVCSREFCMHGSTVRPKGDMLTVICRIPSIYTAGCHMQIRSFIPERFLQNTCLLLWSYLSITGN